jgi:hypothetical protein
MTEALLAGVLPGRDKSSTWWEEEEEGEAEHKNTD